MESKEIAERLFAQLASAARKRQASGTEVVPMKDFDEFIKAVERVASFGVELSKEVPDIRHIGMAFNYYNGAIKFVLTEVDQMKEVIGVPA